MKLIEALCVLALCAFTTTKAWSWEDGQAENKQEEAMVEQADAAMQMKREVALKQPEIEDVVESILKLGREGRNLEGFDQIYTDPSVQEVLQKDITADDPEARNLIKDRLCSLGLMQCDEDMLEKRPHITPEELVYAQPVDIKPIGRPIPSIPVKGPSRAIYGQPKPQIYPIKNGPPLYGPPNAGYGNIRPPNPLGVRGPPAPLGIAVPPRRYGANGPPKPYGPPKPSPIFGANSFLEVDTPQLEFASADFGHNKEIKKKYEGVLSANGDVQQHVHHHYHHGMEGGNVDGKLPIVINNPPQLLKPHEQIDISHLPPYLKESSYGGQTIANYGVNGLNSYAGTTPVVEAGNQYNQGPQTFGINSGSLYTQAVKYGQVASSAPNSFGTSVGSYSTSDFYKKELHLGGQNFNNLAASGYDKQQGLASENYDCICVPYDQCPDQDVIGRKDDLYLPLDPRNLKSDIEAEEEPVNTDSNSTNPTIKIKKITDLNVTDTSSTMDTSRKVKRNVSTESSAETTDKAKVEPRQNNHNTKNVVPTFGVSFGLPQQGIYPLNYQHPNLGLQNPYVNNAGINLGLVSVNPLVSVQVTNDDYGEKVFKPSVNLHITPNNFLVDKVTDFLSHKKYATFNSHYHKHIYKPGYGYGYRYPYHHHQPHYSDGPYLPHHYDGPYLEHPPQLQHNKPFGHETALFERPLFDPARQAEQYIGPSLYGVPGLHELNPLPEVEYNEPFYGRAVGHDNCTTLLNQLNKQNICGGSYTGYTRSPAVYDSYGNPTKPYDRRTGKSQNPAQDATNDKTIKFPTSRRRRDVTQFAPKSKRQAYYGQRQGGNCGPRHVCCRRPLRPVIPAITSNQCGTRHSQGINGRIKNPVYVDGDSEFGEYPWQVAILKKDPKESVYVCGGTLIDQLHIITAAHCVKQYTSQDLRVRLGEWDVNHDVEFFPYIERDISYLHIHPEFYAGTLYNDLAILRMEKPVDFNKYPHISSACLPSPFDDYSNTRCWTTGWGKDAFGDFGKYQNILKEVDVPVIQNGECQQRLKQTRLGYDFKLHPGFVCAGGEEGKDACKGDGGGPMVCERSGTWQVVGVVSWGIGCGQSGVPGVYVKVAHYLDWIKQIIQRY